jgi:ribonuclease Z
LPGPWIKELKRRFYLDNFALGPIEVWKVAGSGHTVEQVEDTEELYRKISRDSAPNSIGYISDVGMTAENLNRIYDLMRGVTLLAAECTFLANDKEKARLSFHLCTTDLNQICREIKPQLLLPMHLSKSYISDTKQLYAELDQRQGTTILQLPDYITQRPLLTSELPSLTNEP